MFSIVTMTTVRWHSWGHTFLSWTGEMNDIESHRLICLRINKIWSVRVGRWHWDDIRYSHLMRMLPHVIVVLVQHLLLRGSRMGGVRACREIVSLTIDSDTLVSTSAECVSWTNRPLMVLWYNSLNKRWTIFLCDVSWLSIFCCPHILTKAVLLHWHQISKELLVQSCIVSFPL